MSNFKRPHGKPDFLFDLTTGALGYKNPLTGIDTSLDLNKAAGVSLAPAPTGIAATDFANLRDFFTSAANNQRIVFPSSVIYPIYSGAIQLKPGQIVDMNGSQIQRAPELVFTTTTTFVNGNNTLGLNSVTGLQVGMTVVVKGAGNTTGNILIAYAGAGNDDALRVLSINASTNVVTFESALSAMLDITAGDVATSEALAVGAQLVVKNVLINARMGVLGGAFTLLNANVDGNWAQNQTANYWVGAAEISCYATGSTVDNFTSINAPGEVFLQHGYQSVLNNFKATNCRGNAIHLNGYNYDTRMTNIWIDGTNLDIGVGHSNGAVIASNNTYRAVLDGFSIRSSRLFGVGSWDSADNSFAKICNGYIRGCWGGAFQLYGSNSTRGIPQGVDVNDVTVRNCGISYIGSDISGSTYTHMARNINLKNITFYDSMAQITKLEDSSIKNVQFIHTDSGTLTASSAASGRKNASGTAMNFGGRIDLSAYGGSSNYNAGPDVVGVCTIGPFVNCGEVEISVRDDTVVAPPTLIGGNIRSYTINHTVLSAGPTVGTNFNVYSKGGHSGPHFEGTFQDCDINAHCLDYGKVNGATAEAFQVYNRTASAAATTPSSSTNGVMGVVVGGTPNISDPNHPGLGYGSGGATTRTQYDMIFSATNQTVEPVGYFIVENGALVDWKITEPGAYSSGTPTISLANATGLINATLTCVMGTTRSRRIPTGNRVNVYVHTENNPSGGYMCKIRQDTAGAAGAGELEVTALLVADSAAGGIGFSDTTHELINVYLKDVRVLNPGGGLGTPIQIQALAGGNIGSCRIGSLNGPSAFATPVGWNTYYTQRGSTNAAFSPLGYVGEILTNTVASGSAVSLTTATAADVMTLALTKGNWVVNWQVDFVLGAATATNFTSGVSVTANTLPTQAGGSGIGTDPLVSTPLLTTGLSDTLGQVGKLTTVSVAADTTLHLVVKATFSAGTTTAYGTVSALRVA